MTGLKIRLAVLATLACAALLGGALLWGSASRPQTAMRTPVQAPTGQVQEQGDAGISSTGPATAESQAAGKQPAQGGTYVLIDPRTKKVVRTGRTNNLERRENEHGRNESLSKYQLKVDKRTDDPAARRGREQIIHDRYQPPLDKINPISPSNPRREEYLQAGKKLGR